MPEEHGSVFDLSEYKRYQKKWHMRLRELNTRAAYYDGSIYRGIRNLTIWTLGPRAVKEIKGLFLPLARAVDIDAGIVGGEWAFPPLEIEPRSEIWDEARDILFDMSRWDTQGILYSHYGALYGVSGLRVADLRDEKRIELQPARPTCFMLIYEGEYSNIPNLAFCVEHKEDEIGMFEYAEVITPEKIRTYRDGVLTGFDDRKPEYKNEQGIIPIVEILHINDGTDLGECTYQKSIPLLNEVNEMATRLSDVIKKNADPQWTIAGAEPSDLVRGSTVMWFLPDANAKVTPVVPTIDIVGVMEFIREIKSGVKESLPELLFDELRKMGQVATPTLEIFCSELVIKIKRVRPNYDRGLVTAMQMAGAAAASMGISELVPLNDPELILDPKRPILPLTPQEAIELEMSEIELEQMQSGRMRQEGNMPPEPMPNRNGAS